MGEKNLWSKVGLIILIVGLSVWQINPPAERLKAGIDLGGGHSLLFEIDDSGLSAGEKAGLAERMMSILKERVDPQGNRNLVWRPIGVNRLEIQMPTPQKGQKDRRAEYDAAREALAAGNITATQIRTAMLLPQAARDAEIGRLSAAVPSRAPLFKMLVEATDKYESAQNATSRPSTATSPVTSQAARELDQALVDRRKATEELLKTNVDTRVLTDLLELGKNNKTREEGLKKLKEAHPELTAKIDVLVEKHDKWARDKGVLDDPSDLMRLLRGAGVLEFRILAEHNKSNPEMTDSSNPRYNEPISRYTDQLAKFGPRPRPEDNYRWFKIAKDDDSFNRGDHIVQEYMGAKYVLAHATVDMGLLADRTWSLAGAHRGTDQMGRSTVDFSLDPRGGNRFGRLTGSNIERPLCIFLDNEAISSATIRSRITTSGQISGSFTPEYVMYLVNTLEAGALPARLKEVPLQQKSVGPSLGDTNREMGRQAVIASFIATIVFMVIYYAYNGAIADIALLMNLVITLGVMSFLQATFTLPGIAGLVLTLGMAVDANVLIFERMREELQRGVSAKMAVKLGYEKAFSAIFDGNVTTIITAAILWWIGSEEIKGFGITLSLGLAISMFTALFVTRQYYNVMVPLSLNRQEVKKAWLIPLILAVAGGAVFALGYMTNAPQQREESSLIGLGKFLGVMFATAVVLLASMWAFRFAYRGIGHQQANRLPMMKLMSAPKIDWMGKYKVFWTISACTIFVGLILMWVGLKDSKLLDIEFVGGTNVQLQVKGDPRDEDVRRMIAGPREDGKQDAVGWLNSAADQIASATVTPSATAGYGVTAGKLTPTQLQALLLPVLEKGRYTSRGGVSLAENGITVQFQGERADQEVKDQASAQNVIRQSAAYLRAAAANLRNVRVQAIKDESGSGKSSFDVVTTETSRSIVSEAIIAALGDDLEASRPVDAVLLKDPERAPDGIFPIRTRDTALADVIGGSSQEGVVKFHGGAAFVFDNLQPPQTAKQIAARIGEMRLQPDFESVAARESQVIGLVSAGGVGDNETFKKMAVVVSDPTLLYVEGENNEVWRGDVADKELALVKAALASSRSLQRVTQFAPQVAAEAAQRAIIAVILSLIAIAAYMWIRFGSAEFGVAGILGLYHDVAVALACVVGSHYVYDSFLGRALLLQDFKIDLNIIAALLTIIGFSINDVIVIFDRVRENRGRMGVLSTRLVNDSINQTLSRTILTVFTVLVVVAVLYVYGGEGIHGFAFTMLIGTISGSYSTFAISCTLLRHQRVMWAVTALIVGITAVGIIFMLTSGALSVVLAVIVAALTVWGLYKMELVAPAAERA